VKPYQPHLFVLCVLALIFMTEAHKPLQNALAAMRFNWLPRQASGDIVLVAIDSPSINKIGVWPWPRTIHAELINKLDGAGASEIVFDVDFSSASTPAADLAFEDALRNAGGSVVLPAFQQWGGDRGNRMAVHVDRPLPQFARHAWPAAINVEPDPDGLVRRYPLGQTLGDTFLPSVGALLAGRYENSGASLLIDFGIQAASVPTISYVDVLGGDAVILRALRGKKVIVGATAVELGDRINVPNGKIVPGAMLQAIAAESILQGRTLRTGSVVVTIGGIGLIVLAMSALWRRFAVSMRIGILISLSVAIELSATVLQAKAPVVVDTSLWHAAVFAYLVALALDEIDLRDLLGTIAEKRFQRITMSLGDGLVCADRGGSITLWNPAAAAIFGYQSEEMVGQPFGKIVASGICETETSWSITDLPYEAVRTHGGKVMEFQGCRKNGETFPFEACFSAWQGADGLQYGAVLRDISVRKREEERIRYLATYDTLTGLPNRNTLYGHLDLKLHAPKIEGREVALLIMDLDRFKDINDTLGHACGDEVLRAVAGRLYDIAGKTGMIARMSGDEFAIVISGADAAERAEKLSERISEAFENDEFSVGDRKLRIKCSIGVALCPRDCENVHELLANADLAMFRAKTIGRSKHVFFNRTIRGELEARLLLTAQLEQAYTRGEFELFYQPQVHLKDGSLVGAEALIRWRHPERGFVSPADFLPTLDTISIADKVSRWVVETACRQGSLWRQKGHDIRLGVNLSPSQFKSGDLAGAVATVLTETGFPPSLLELEVTENILLADDERARNIFRRIRDLGAHIALDDFGTGYASLNYLKKFPLDRLKIDQFFVRELKPDSNDAAIIAYTINLSRLLGLSVIAEGVEDSDTVDLLVKLGCEEGQGHHFGVPMPAAKFEQIFLSKTVSPACEITAEETAADVA
jgi:diguanylate cyclase (GGDEF)-like protein/PAS domain S-box-containing protein